MNIYIIYIHMLNTYYILYIHICIYLHIVYKLSDCYWFLMKSVVAYYLINFFSICFTLKRIWNICLYYTYSATKFVHVVVPTILIKTVLSRESFVSLTSNVVASIFTSRGGNQLVLGHFPFKELLSNLA